MSASNVVTPSWTNTFTDVNNTYFWVAWGVPVAIAILTIYLWRRKK